MQTKTIYIIRHGETEYNRKGIVQGSGIDAPLNDTGFMQARAFYEAYRDTPFTKVYTSALRRTVQTVMPFLEGGLPHKSLSGLNEINWGEKEGKVASEEDHQYYKFVIESWRKGKLDQAIEGGESPLMVMERQKRAVEHIIADQDNPVLVCMHGRAMRILLCHLLGHDLSRMDDFKHANLCLYIVEYDYATGLFSLKVENERSHL